MKSRKGFTLVELIVTITLLALFGVAIGLTLNKTFKNNEEKEYKEFVAKIESSANLYLNNNFELLNQLYEKKGYIYITIGDLVDNGLLSKDLINPKTHKTVDLNELIKVSLDSSGVIKITYPAPESNEPYLQTIDIMLNAGSTEPPEGYCWYGLNTVSLGYIDKDGNLDSSYLIKNTNIKCSIKNNSTISTNKIGTYELKYEYKTTEGKWKSTTRKVVIVDKKVPTCEQIDPLSPVSWTNTTREVKVSCIDDESGCVRPLYSKTFSSSVENSEIAIKDKSGNIFNCPVIVKVDKTNPICGTITGSSLPWTKEDRTITVGCEDNHSGCKNSVYTKTYTSTTLVDTIKIEDRVDNSNSCVVTVNVDKTSPTCSQIDTPTSWTNKDRTVTVSCLDIGSGCAKFLYSNDYSSTIKEDTIEIEDNIGNTTSCPVTIKVDKIAPSCGTITGESTIWTKDNRKIIVKCSDSDSTCVKSEYSKEYKTTTKQANIEIKDQAGNSKNCKVNVYVDKTAPATTLTLSGTNFVGTGQDSDSGLKYYQFSTSSSLTDISKTGTEITPTISKKEYTYPISISGKTTWYFYTQDVAGNIGKSSIQVDNASIKDYNIKSQTCEKGSIKTYKCSKSYDKCASGWEDCPSSWCSTSNCKKKVSSASTSTVYTKTTQYCNRTLSSSRGPETSDNHTYSCSCPKGTTFVGFYGKSAGCSNNYTNQNGRYVICRYYSCTAGYTQSGSGSSTYCYKYTYSFNSAVTAGTGLSSCQAHAIACNSSNYQDTKVMCSASTAYYCPSGGTIATGTTDCYKYSNYQACTIGTDNGSQCVLTNQTSKKDGWSCSADTYDYIWKESNSTGSSCTSNSFSCNSDNVGKTKVSCEINSYKCSDKTYTLKGKYCYK